jgi:fatty-acid peroxygenase
MKDALRFLVFRIDYDVPPQNLAVDETKVPAVPRSRFVMHSVTMREAGTAASPVVSPAVKQDQPASRVANKKRAR